MTGRTAEHPIEPLFLDRWSPRAFDGSVVTETELSTLFEAARWAPSSMNAQPWRYLYSRRDTPDWGRFLDLLAPSNRLWAKNAGALAFALSDRLVQRGEDAAPRPSHSHSFDAGASWMLLALQATRMGLATHGMTGVDLAAAREAFGVPDRFRVECAIAIGRPGDRTSLPEPLQARERPSDRKPIASFAFAGDFPTI